LIGLARRSRRLPARLGCGVFLIAAGAGCEGGGAGAGPAAMSLAFADEFDGPAGARPDVTRWVNDVGGNGWGNNELQYYTNSTRNAALDGAGHLVVTAIAETMGGRSYTSARIKTQGTFEQAYGRFEARIQLPSGRGLWPAFWLLGSNLVQAGWPACGEIDVMEAIGSQPSVNRGSLHGPSYSGGAALTVNNGGLPIIELSAGATLPMLTFHVPASALPVGREKRKYCGFCVMIPPLVSLESGWNQFT